MRRGRSLCATEKLCASRWGAVELRQAIRNDVEASRRVTDNNQIKFLISDGLKRMKELQDMIHMCAR